jgi:hypothetical protein
MASVRDVVVFVMALLSFQESTPGAYGLKASNAALSISTSIGTSPIAPEGAELVYFAFVNYTTLGYGDIVPVERWRLLGPMTAMNGVLLFGWSTAVIFEVLRKAMRREMPEAK